jgi:TolB-like protein
MDLGNFFVELKRRNVYKVAVAYAVVGWLISRTSTQHYKSAPENLPEIARQLGVAHVLEGSVQKSGDAVRVNVQLIKAANDSNLWADTFDRN